MDGLYVGTELGVADGSVDTTAEGAEVGEQLGTAVLGRELGTVVGSSEGANVLGNTVG